MNPAVRWIGGRDERGERTDNRLSANIRESSHDREQRDSGVEGDRQSEP